MKSAYEFNKEKLRQAVPAMTFADGNFAAWQLSAREKLTELLGLNRFVRTSPEIQVEYEQQQNEVKEIRFTFQSEAGYRVPCHLFLPAGIQKPPVMLCIHPKFSISKARMSPAGKKSFKYFFSSSGLDSK